MSFLDKLLTHMAMRNGNHQFLYLFLKSNIELKSSSDNHVRLKSIPTGLSIEIPNDPDMDQAIKAVDDFYVSCLEKHDITIEQLTDVSFLKEHKHKNNKLIILIEALEKAESLYKSLTSKHKMDLYESIDRFYNEEKSLLLKEFRDINPNYSHLLLNSETLYKYMSSDKSFSLKLVKLYDREEILCSQIPSDSDIENLLYFNTIPNYMKVLVLRIKLGIELIVKLSLDNLITSV